VHDLEHVSGLDGHGPVLSARNDLTVPFYRDGPLRQPEVQDQTRQGQTRRDLMRFAVDRHAEHGTYVGAPPSGCQPQAGYSDNGIGIQNVFNRVMLPRRS
jgi:hypothetical protein